MGLRPTQGGEKRLLSSNESSWKRRPILCHLGRSARASDFDVPSNLPNGARTSEVRAPLLLTAPPAAPSGVNQRISAQRFQYIREVRLGSRQEHRRMPRGNYLGRSDRIHCRKSRD
jgi:hypothetical protein